MAVHRAGTALQPRRYSRWAPIVQTDHLSADEMLKLETQAAAAFEALPPEEQDLFYGLARQRYGPNWSSFGVEARAMCALLEYISQLPEPPSRRN